MCREAELVAHQIHDLGKLAGPLGLIRAGWSAAFSAVHELKPFLPARFEVHAQSGDLAFGMPEHPGALAQQETERRDRFGIRKVRASRDALGDMPGQLRI